MPPAPKPSAQECTFSTGDDFICPICINVLEDPQRACANSHAFCRECLAKHADTLGLDSSCPACRAPLERGEDGAAGVAFPLMRRLLETSVVKCSFGCGQAFALGEMRSHRAVCRFAHVRCPYREVGCDWEGVREDLSRHFTEADAEHLHLETNYNLQEVKKVNVLYREEIAKLQDGTSQTASALHRLEERCADLSADRVRSVVKEEVSHVTSAMETLNEKVNAIGDALGGTLDVLLRSLHASFQPALLDVHDDSSKGAPSDAGPSELPPDKDTATVSPGGSGPCLLRSRKRKASEEASPTLGFSVQELTDARHSLARAFPSTPKQQRRPDPNAVPNAPVQRRRERHSRSRGASEGRSIPPLEFEVPEIDWMRQKTLLEAIEAGAVLGGIARARMWEQHEIKWLPTDKGMMTLKDFWRRDPIERDFSHIVSFVFVLKKYVTGTQGIVFKRNHTDYNVDYVVYEGDGQQHEPVLREELNPTFVAGQHPTGVETGAAPRRL